MINAGHYMRLWRIEDGRGAPAWMRKKVPEALRLVKEESLW